MRFSAFGWKSGHLCPCYQHENYRASALVEMQGSIIRVISAQYQALAPAVGFNIKVQGNRMKSF